MPHLNRWSPLLIITLPFLIFWRWWLRGEVIFWGTPLFQFWPWHALAKSIALSGEWPLWNPLLGNGTPLLANLQTAFFYPPNILYFLLPVEHGLTLSTILHLSLAGVLMYTYTRYIGLHSFAAMISALTYMFSGYLVGRIQFVTMINALAWFPLLLLLGEQLTTQRRLKDVLWLGCVWAIQLLAGHAQLWFYGLWLVGGYTFFRLWQQRSTFPSTFRAMLRLGLSLSAALALAVLLAAIQIIPTAEFVSQSPRSSGAGRYFALSYSFWPWRLLTLLAPDFFGHPAQGNYWGYANFWEDHAYIGTLPFIFALLAAKRYMRPAPASTAPSLPPVGPFFITLVPTSLLLALGWNTPVYLWVFDHVPGFGYFQAPSRLLIWYTLAVSILAGIGAEHFQLSPQNRRGWQRWLVICLGMTMAGGVGMLVLSGVKLTFLWATTRLGGLLALSAILFLSQPSVASGHRFRWQLAVLLFVIVDLWWAAAPLIPLLPATIFRQPIASAETLAAYPPGYRFFVAEDFDHRLKFDQFFRFETFGEINLAHWQRLRETLAPNFGVYAGLASANNDDPLVVGRWQSLTVRVADLDISRRAALLGLMNVGYLINDPGKAVWPAIYMDDLMVIQQIPEPLPRAYFVPQAFPAADEEAGWSRLNAPDFDSRREVVIMNEVNIPVTSPIEVQVKPPVTDFTTVRLTEQGTHQLSLSIDAPTAGYVVLTDTFYPGWQVTVDDKPAKILLANLAFRAVAVDAGAHIIIFKYQPLSFTLGAWISGLTLLGVIFLSKGMFT